MFPDTQFITSEDATIAIPSEFFDFIPVPPPRKPIWEKILDFVSEKTRTTITVLVLIVVVLVVASVFLSILKRKRS